MWPERRRWLAAALLGALFTLSFAPVFAWPLVPVALSGLYILIVGSDSPKQAFRLGWFFGFGHHVTGLYWTAYALLTDAAAFGWLIPFSVSLIPAALAVYIGLAAYAWRRWAHSHVGTMFGVALFATLWLGAELLRGWLFTGFPWNLAGYALSFSGAMIQGASVVGVYGLSFLLVLAGCAPALLILNPWRQKIVPVLLAAVLLPAAGYGYGTWRLSGSEGQPDTGIRLRIVQANIPQKMKWKQEQRFMNLHEQIRLSNEPGKPNLIIWPETATPYFLHEDKELQKLMAEKLGAGTTLITGAMRYNQTGPGEDDYDLFNALEVFRGGTIAAHYEKSLLVPFGEYIPLRPLLPFVQKITQGSRDFVSGPGAIAVAPPGLPPFAALICYEAIFPGYRTASGTANWLINITNDGWFGISSGPYQHFEMARMRAVEQGLPLVRAANTGISAVVDPYGRVKAVLGLGEKGVVDAVLPAKINNQTPYVNTFGLILCILVTGTLTIVRIAGKLWRKR